MEKKRKESGWMKYFKIPEWKIKIWSSIKICRFSLDVCRQVFLYAFYRPDFQKFSKFPDYQKTQPSICFKTSDQDFQTLRKIIGWGFKVFWGNQKLSPAFLKV